MRAEIRIPASSPSSQRPISALIPLALLTVGVPWAIWSVFALLTTGASATVPFAVAAGTFLISGIGYVALHGIRNMRWTSVSFVLTLESLICFMAVPVWQFVSGAGHIDSGYAHSMFLVLIGFTAFWVGSLVLMRPNELYFTPRDQRTSERIKLVSLALLILGVGANFAMWRAGLFGYLADPSARASHAGMLQWITFAASLMDMALIVSAIEVLGKSASGILIKAIFIFSFLFSLGFGLISGMKSAMLEPFIYIVIVHCAIKRRLPRMVFLLPLFLIVFVYPFVTAYRNILRGGYSAQINTVGGLIQNLEQSYNDAFNAFGESSSSSRTFSSNEATERMSYLTYVRNVIDLPAPSLLNGDEKLWQAPLYPFVPRFLWKNKPIEDKGVRLALALGSGPGTSAALTPIGDLYSMYGASGVVIGMMVYGLCIQLYMNWRGKYLSESGLFIYILLLGTLMSFESGIVGLITADIHSALVFMVMAYIIYGRPTTIIAWRSRRSLELPDRER